MAFVESGVTLDFPDINHFRFTNCPGYQKLSGHDFKEMDFCWIDETNKKLYLVELKHYTSFKDNKAYKSFKEAVDATIMIQSVFLGTPYSSNISQCFPIQIDISYEIILLIIVNNDQNTDDTLNPLRDKFRALFYPYATLLNVTHYSLISYNFAKTNFPQFIK